MKSIHRPWKPQIDHWIMTVVQKALISTYKLMVVLVKQIFRLCMQVLH